MRPVPKKKEKDDKIKQTFLQLVWSWLVWIVTFTWLYGNEKLLDERSTEPEPQNIGDVVALANKLKGRVLTMDQATEELKKQAGGPSTAGSSIGSLTSGPASNYNSQRPADPAIPPPPKRRSNVSFPGADPSLSPSPSSPSAWVSVPIPEDEQAKKDAAVKAEPKQEPPKPKPAPPAPLVVDAWDTGKGGMLMEYSLKRSLERQGFRVNPIIFVAKGGSEGMPAGGKTGEKETKRFAVWQGKMSVQLEGQEPTMLKAGDSVLIPRNTAYTLAYQGASDLHFFEAVK